MKKTKPASKPKTKREAAVTEIVAKTAKPAKAPKAVKTRGRQGNVRSLILELLAGGPMPTSELVTKGKFSSAAAFMHLKALRNEGTVSATRQGREVFYSLTGTIPVAAEASAPSEAAAPRKRGRKPKAAKGAPAPKAPNTSVDSALAGLARRLAPIEQIGHKVSVLNQLAGSLPTSVASVLNAIRDDLHRFSA